MKTLSILFIAAALCSAPALGAVVITSTSGYYNSDPYYGTESGALPVMSSTDLLQTSVASIITGGNMGAETGMHVSALTDGIAATEHSALHTFGSNSFITYMLDLTSNPQGYDIGRIDIQSGWPDTGRVNLTTLVYFSTIAAPDTFSHLGTASFVLPGGTPNRPWITATFTDNSSAILASQVAGLRFEFPSQQNSYVGYGEIDVLGVPEPSKTAFLGVFISAVLMRRRRPN
ncbi:MAG: hypothetical protein B7Z47_02590 [Chthoniobacter sp. 12-60-6]|nr:MAG: hypothetical protein B7Z47_02590 [Chthoniobacter sp. 12-60-6]